MALRRARGLAWEHASTGRSPEAAKRWSAVDLDTDTYEVWHDGTSLEPFPAALGARTVVFDPPYFDLERAPSVRGVMNWGAHDPGRRQRFTPERADRRSALAVRKLPGRRLHVRRRVAFRRAHLRDGASADAGDRRAHAHRALVARRALPGLGPRVRGRRRAALGDRGVLARLRPDASAAPDAVGATPRAKACARSTARTTASCAISSPRFPDATVVAFSMNGMGPNRSDVASMMLLSELLYRHAFGKPLLHVPAAWIDAPGGMPMLAPGQDWSQAVKSRLSPLPEPLDLVRRAAARVLPESVKRVLRPNGHAPAPSRDGTLRLSLDWMPTGMYQPYWHAMRFFALPSFYDGRVRVNLAGRERDGMVPVADYEKACDEVESLVRACRDLHSGEPVVAHVERPAGRDPLAIGPSESDLVIVWRAPALGFAHAEIGRIGPLPYRRTGGHTGPYGMAYIAGDRIEAGDRGVRSSFDVVPTIVELLGERPAPDLSGRSLFH
jgi:hypothetical protein